MAHAAHQNDFSFFDASMRGPFITSGLFHLLIFLLTIIGIPYVIKPPVEISTPISVEIVEIAEKTQTTKLQAPTSKPEEESKPLPQTVPESKPSPPPQMTEAPPDLTKPEPVEKTPAPVILKPAPKKPPVRTPEKKKDIKDINSLLKNLTPDAKEKTEKKEDIKDVLNNVVQGQAGNLADKLTMSEIDALRHQLSQCWNVLSGAKYAENLVVEVRVVVNPDRTVQRATIINQPLYNQDTYYRAAADAAIRALHNPRCSPLALPPDKYNEWKVTTITFDPREML